MREQISSEMWEQMNRLFLAVRRDVPDASWTSHTHEFLAWVMEGVHLFQGITDATMTHGEGWQYIELGRYIERASATAALLDVHYRDFPGGRDQPAEVGEYVEWVALLRSCCAFEAYCRHYTADLRSIRIAEFLILNPDFPRSIRFGASRIQASLKAIAALTGRGGRAERLAGRLLASLDYGQVDEIVGDQLPATSRASSGSPTRSMPPSTSSTSTTPSTPRCRPDPCHTTRSGTSRASPTPLR